LKFKEYGFPLDFTSTTLDSAVPGLVDLVGYDVELSARFVNRGAPRFLFKKDEMYVIYNLTVEIWDELFSKRLFKVHYTDIETSFSMVLENSFELNVDWISVSMKSAQVDNCENLLKIRNQERANQHIVDFFTWSFDLILPWVQYKKPPGLSQFNLPENIPNLLRFKHITLSVEKNFLNFGMDLVFDTAA